MVNRRGFLAAGALATPLLAGSSALAAERQRAAVVTGAETLAAQGWRSLAGRKVGVLSNPTGVLENRRLFGELSVRTNLSLAVRTGKTRRDSPTDFTLDQVVDLFPFMRSRLDAPKRPEC